MLILLPPSEGKAEPSGDGKPAKLDELVFADVLTESRARLLDGLAGLPELDRDQAVSLLGISPGQAADVDRDAVLRKAPAAPASEVYTGVLYDRLDFPGLSARARKRASKNLLIASGLWGVIRPDDRIPNYRFPAKARLPEAGPLPKYWRGPLTKAFQEAGYDEPGETVLDMRSAAYSSAWKPRNARLVPVRAFTESGGTRKTVSHMAKATRGEVARIVLTAGRMPEGAEEVADLVSSTGLTVELSDDGLDVIEAG
ncbi:MAG: YaaA family protein [Solirubrobacterales bacterium]